MTPPRPVTSQPSPQLLRNHVREFLDGLPRVVAGDQEALHQLRVKGRRLRLALAILPARTGGRAPRRCRATLRRLIRAAGAARDLDVATGLLETQLLEAGLTRTNAGLVRQHLKATRRRRHVLLARTLLDADIARLRNDLGNAVARGCAPAAASLQRARRRLDARGAVVVAGIAALGRRLDVEALHALRRSARQMRYLAEQCDAIAACHTEAPAGLKRIQDTLGRIHDHGVLASWLVAHRRRALARGQSGLARASAVLRARAEQAMVQFHRDYLNSRPRAIVLKAMETVWQAPGAGAPEESGKSM